MSVSMPGKKHSMDEIIAAFREIQILVGRGAHVADAAHGVGITEVTYYRWRRRFGGLSDDQIRRQADIAAENSWLRRVVSELQLDKRILRAAFADLLSTPMGRRKAVDRIMTELSISERRACQVLGQNRSTQRKIPKMPGRLRNRDTLRERHRVQ
jgi:putative transposase